MAESRALSGEILALFETIRQQAHAYAAAFARVEELVQQLQQQREHVQRDAESFRQQAQATLEHLRREVDQLIAVLTERAATVRELAARLSTIEAEIARLSQLPERFAEQVAEALAQAETLIRAMEQKVAIILRSLQEELRDWQQRVEGIRVLTQHDLAAVRQEMEQLQRSIDPAQLRQQLLQTLEPRFQQIEAQVEEVAKALLHLPHTQQSPPPEPPPRPEPAALLELQHLRQRLTSLEKRLAFFPFLFGVLALGVVLALLLALLTG